MTDVATSGFYDWLVQQYAPTTARLYLGMVRRMIAQGCTDIKSVTTVGGVQLSANRRIAWRCYQDWLAGKEKPFARKTKTGRPRKDDLNPGSSDDGEGV